MHYIWPILFLLLTMPGFSQTTDTAVVDTSIRYVVLPLDSFAERYINMPDIKPTTITDEETQQIDSILKICIAANNNGGKPYIHGIHIGNNNYRHQLIPFIDKRGEKLVWVNSVCWEVNYPAETIRRGKNKVVIPEVSWRKDLIVTHDGGNCYWRVVVNLSSKTYTNLSVNGF